jgi:hypothetical protein
LAAAKVKEWTLAKTATKKEEGNMMVVRVGHG